MTGDERRDEAGGDRLTRRRALLRTGGTLLASSVAGCMADVGLGGAGRQDGPANGSSNATATSRRNASNSSDESAANTPEAASGSDAPNGSDRPGVPDPSEQTFPFTEPMTFIGFENENYERQFTQVDEWNAENRRVVPRSASEGSGLAVTMSEGEHWGTILRYEFRAAGYEEPEELYARYYLYFPEEFQAVRGGGKLPGFSGEYNGLAFGGHPVDGTDGWSARTDFEPAYRGARPTEVPLSLYYYVYHADMDGQYGDRFYWDGRVERGRWYRIDQYVRMNTPGKRNAVLRAWVDGDLACNETYLRFRDVGYDYIKVKSYLLTTYYGGFWTSPVDNTVFFDALTLSWPGEGIAAGNGTGSGPATNGTGSGPATNGTRR